MEDVISIMSGFNPAIEQNLIWSYSYSKIKHRWEIWQKWDIVYRVGLLFGGEEPEKKETKVFDNSEDTFEKVCNLLPKGSRSLN